MKNVIRVLTVIIAVFALATCNNFFHDLIPPDDNIILSFEVDGQIGEAEISDNSIIVTVEKGTEIHSLIPRIKVSNKATLFPVTLDYVQAAFPNANLAEAAMKMSRTTDLVTAVTDLIKENPNFNVPSLNIPFDFTGPVTILVMSGQGNIRQYIVNVVEDSGNPKILNMRFSKYNNPELVSDALCGFNGKNIWVYALYPAEMRDELSFALVPSFEILGEKLEIDIGTYTVDYAEITSSETPVQYRKYFNTPFAKNIKVTRNGIEETYTLYVIFSEDPDSIRSITDFRFTVDDNSDIASNAVSLIVNNDNTGTISVQVYYTGAKPSTLIPRFISPGTVSVGNNTQTTGVNSHDFSSPIQYRVVSRNGLYVRTYTVKTEFINITGNMPSIMSFKFSVALNPELVQDSQGQISNGSIFIEARYGGTDVPENIAPEFTADGIVKVSGSVQVSGASSQNFMRKIKYTVENPQYSGLTRDYWVECSMIRDTSSYAAITSFSFHPDDNGGYENCGLTEETYAKIDHAMGIITVYVTAGHGITTKILSPRFTAAGQVSVGGTPQVSGQSGQMFDSPITYTVVSPNGNNKRTYIVNLKELQSTVFVNASATGLNDGTSWENAFVNLKDACDLVALVPEDMPKEVWIAKGTYKPKGTTSSDYFPLVSSTSYIGGFAGYETNKNQRNPSANPVIISGNSGNSYLFYRQDSGVALDWDYEYILWEKHRKYNADTGRYVLDYDAYEKEWNEYLNEVYSHNPIPRRDFWFYDLQFKDLNAYGNAVYLYGSGTAEFTNVIFDNLITSGHGAAISSNGYNVVLKNSIIRNCASHCAMIVMGSDDYSSQGLGNLTMINSEIYNNKMTGMIYGTVMIQSGTFTMDGGKISNNTCTYQYGAGVDIRSNATFIMNSGTISGNINISTDNPSNKEYIFGGGVYVNGGNFIMNGGTISGNIVSGHGGGVYVNGTFTMNGGTISANIAQKSGGGVYSMKTFTQKNGTISGNTAIESGGGVYVNGGKFIKSGGTITGYANDNSLNGNVVKDNSNVVQNGKGHAVYAAGGTEEIEVTTTIPGEPPTTNTEIVTIPYVRRRENTVNDNLSYDYNGGSPNVTGTWEQ